MNYLSYMRFSAIILALLFLYSCGKYEEGPKASIRSKKNRLTGTWSVSSQVATIDGNTVNFDAREFTGTKIVFNKDNTWQQLNQVDKDEEVADQGEWQFADDTKLFLFSDIEGGHARWEITKLKHLELWTRLDTSMDILGERVPIMVESKFLRLD